MSAQAYVFVASALAGDKHQRSAESSAKKKQASARSDYEEKLKRGELSKAARIQGSVRPDSGTRNQLGGQPITTKRRLSV